MSLCWLFSFVLCLNGVLCSQAVFGSSESLRLFLAEHKLADRHIGVGFDVVRGVSTNMKLFGANTAVDLDPLSAKARFVVTELVHHRDAYQMRAHEMHCSFLRGMFVRDQTLSQLFSEPVVGSSVVLGTRSDVFLVLKLRAQEAFTRLDPRLGTVLADLPDRYNASDTVAWDNFFSLYPTHFTVNALVGSKLTISGQVANKERANDVKTAFDLLLHTGSKEKAESLAGMGVKERILVQGGQPGLLSGSLRLWNEVSHSSWLESVKTAPTVIGYHVRPVSDLVMDPQKKAALLTAIESRLQKVYERWRAERVQHDQTSKLLDESLTVAKFKLQHLESRRESVKQALEKQKALIQTCEDEIARVNSQTHRCRDEIKAFTKALLECDARNLNNEHAEDDLATCLAKKRLLGCK